MIEPYYHEIPWRRVGSGLLPLWRGLVRAKRWLDAPVKKPPDRWLMLSLWVGWSIGAAYYVRDIVEHGWP